MLSIISAYSGNSSLSSLANVIAQDKKSTVSDSAPNSANPAITTASRNFSPTISSPVNGDILTLSGKAFLRPQSSESLVKNLTKANDSLGTISGRIASGKATTNSYPNSFLAARGLSTKMGSLSGVLRQNLEARNVVALGSSALENISDILRTVQSSVTDAFPDSVPLEGKVEIAQNITRAVDQIQTIVDTTVYSGRAILDGTYAADFLLGVDKNNKPLFMTLDLRQNLEKNPLVINVNPRLVLEGRSGTNGGNQTEGGTGSVDSGGNSGSGNNNTTVVLFALSNVFNPNSGGNVYINSPNIYNVNPVTPEYPLYVDGVKYTSGIPQEIRNPTDPYTGGMSELYYKNSSGGYVAFYLPDSAPRPTDVKLSEDTLYVDEAIAPTLPAQMRVWTSFLNSTALRSLETGAAQESKIYSVGKMKNGEIVTGTAPNPNDVQDAIDKSKDQLSNSLNTGTSGSSVQDNTSYAGVSGLNIRDFGRVSERSLGLMGRDKIAETIQKITDAVEKVGRFGSYFGTVSSRLDSVQEQALSLQTNYSASLSRITDSDVARDQMEFLKTSLQRDTALFLLTQANMQSSTYLSLRQNTNE